MHYKLIYIILITSSIFSQSFFNRIVPEEIYFNGAKSMSIGRTIISTDNSSGSIISNPALLSNNVDGLSIDMNFEFRAISERRSIIFKDEWEEALGETDYVFNQNNYFNNGYGITYNKTFERFKVSTSISQKPFLSLNYNYEEEIRGDSNLGDGVLGIRDPIVGYQTYSTSGTSDVQSFGISFSLENKNKRNFSFGMGINNILDTKLIDKIELIIIDDSYGLDNMSSIDNVTNSYLLTSEDSFFTLGFQIPFTKDLTLTLSYEEDIMLGYPIETFDIDVSNIVGLPQLFGFENDQLTYLIEGLVYQKPEKKNLGLTYLPQSNINMLLAFEITNRYWESEMGGMDNNINEYKLGFEYAPYNSYPIRAGLVYSESPFNSIEPTSILTLGTGKKIGRIEFDLAMNYATYRYKYFDIFPLEDIYNLNCEDVGCDNVTENKLTFLTTFKIGF